jgi:hypothetical protein
MRFALKRAGRGHAAPVISLGRRAQSLYFAISLAKRRKKAIAPYLPSGPEPDFGAPPRTLRRPGRRQFKRQDGRESQPGEGRR